MLRVLIILCLLISIIRGFPESETLQQLRNKRNSDLTCGMISKKTGYNKNTDEVERGEFPWFVQKFC